MQFLSLIALLKLQSEKWPKTIRYPLRFILCGMFTFLSFSVYELLKGVTVENQNSLLIAAFGQPSLFLLIVYIVLLGFGGLYSSLLSVALFNTLLPKHK
jgi:hypothetical protein